MKCVSSLMDASMISYKPCPIPRYMSFTNAWARFGSVKTAASDSWSFGVRSRTLLQPVTPRPSSAAMVRWIWRLMVSLSPLERDGRAGIEHALLGIVLALRVPRLGVQYPELVQHEEVVSAGVQPQVVHAHAGRHATRHVVSDLHRLETDERRVAEEIGIGIGDPVFVGAVEGARTRGVGIVGRPAIRRVLRGEVADVA